MFMKFSPEWNPRLELAEVQVETDEKNYKEAEEVLLKMYKYIFGLDDVQEAGRKMRSFVRLDKAGEQGGAQQQTRLSGDAETIKAFKTLAPHAKVDKTIRSATDSEIVVGGTAEQRMKAFLLFQALKADKSLA